jgi:hypothetical protein
VHLAAASCATVLVDLLLCYHPPLRVAALGAICRMLEMSALRQMLYTRHAPARLALPLPLTLALPRPFPLTLPLTLRLTLALRLILTLPLAPRSPLARLALLVEDVQRPVSDRLCAARALFGSHATMQALVSSK